MNSTKTALETVHGASCVACTCVRRGSSGLLRPKQDRFYSNRHCPVNGMGRSA